MDNKKQNEKDIDFILSNSNQLINQNEDSSFKMIDFNINPFNEKNDNNELEDNNNSSIEDEEFILAEDDLKNTFKIEYNNYLKNREINDVEESNINGINYLKNDLKNENNNKKLTRVPSNPLPLSYMNNMNLNQLFSFYQNPISNSLNGNNYINTINFPNDSFSMNGKSGWICPNCKNFNYESMNIFIFIILVRVQCNRCGRTSTQIIFNSNHSSTNNLHSNNLYFKNQFFGNNFCLNMNLFDNNYSSKKQSENEKKKKKPFIEREGDWICTKCKNLNFSFRNSCNRCNLIKKKNK